MKIEHVVFFLFAVIPTGFAAFLLGAKAAFGIPLFYVMPFLFPCVTTAVGTCLGLAVTTFMK